jgi:hypothetical protein
MRTLTIEGETFVIPETTFSQIHKLARTHRVCRVCENAFDEKENPMVAQSVCLSCFTKENESLNLTAIPFTSETGAKTYRFLDSEGYVYTSAFASESVEAFESISLTLAYWGFPDVDTIELEGTLVELDPIDASIFGDLKTNSVVVLSKRKKGGRLEVTFLCYKHGTCVYLDKAKGYTRKVWREAESKYLATKDARGRYHYKDRLSRQPSLSDEYCLLSDLESARYDTKHQKENTSDE